MWWTLLLSIAGAGLLHEWHRLRDGRCGGACHLAVLVAWVLLYGQHVSLVDPSFLSVLPAGGVQAMIPVILSLLLMGLLAQRARTYRPGDAVLAHAGFSLLGLVYCIFPLLLAVVLRLAPLGGEWLCYLFAVVWGTDTGAYLVGRAIGRHRMAPVLSPGKTWEGFVGGLVFGALAGVLALWLLALPGSGPGTGTLVLLGVLLAAASHAGDLIESLLKREFGVKDAGNLIPGHGGLLDRLDSLLLAVPVFVLLKWWLL